jgi:alkylation response protein AidB-like acyl-CoA dehydrogenase
MDLSLTAEQVLLQDNVARFATEHGRADNRSLARDMTLDRRMWRDIAELGWLGAGLPEDKGGFGGTAVETMIILEGAGKGLLQAPLLSAMVMAPQILVDAGCSAEALAPFVAGEEIYVAELSEKPAAGVALDASGDGLILLGRIDYMPYGDTVDGYVMAVLERPSGDMALVKVTADDSAIKRKAYRTLDGQPGATVTFDQLRLAPEAVIARGDVARQALRSAADHALAALCAEAVGIAQGLFDRTLAYLKQREQFGQTIGRFQALQHRMADMMVALEEARSLAVMATVALLDPQGDARTRRLSAARIGVLSRTLHIGREAIQLHGGIGMTEEMPIGEGFRRLKSLDLLFGGADTHLDRVAARYSA